MKNNKAAHIAFLSGICIYLLLIGYWRDHVFVSLNYQALKVFKNGHVDFELPHDLYFLEGLSYAQLYWLKFPLTLFFSLAYFLPSWLVVRRFFPGRKFLRITSAVYGATFCLSLMIFAIGYLLGPYDACYSVSRYIMGILQSPLLLMLLAIAFRLSSGIYQPPQKSPGDIPGTDV